MLKMKILHPEWKLEMAGELPYWLDESDPRPAKEQLGEGYQRFGGWEPFIGHTMRPQDDALLYPGDPPQLPYVEFTLRSERILIYPGDWVAIVQPDRSYEICRMD